MKLSEFTNRNKQGTKLIESSQTWDSFSLDFGNLDGTPCKSNFLSKEVLASVANNDETEWIYKP